MKTAYIAATALTLPALAITSAALARPMTAEDVIALKNVSEVEVSPDGQRIAITVASLPDIATGEENGTAERRLYVATGANNAGEFLPADMNVSRIAFSPDGRTISFLWTDDGGNNGDAKRALYAIPVDGGGHRKIAEVEGANISDYVWGPGGASVYLLAAAAEDTQRKKESDAGFNAIVYEEEQKFTRLFRANIQPGTSAIPNAIDVVGEVSDMRVSPDGKWLAVASAPSTRVDDSYTSKRISILDAASGKNRAVIETPGKIADFEISPDGRMLSLIAAVDRNDPAPTTVHLVDAVTGQYRALNADAAEAAIDTEWMDDGRLAVAVDIGAQSELRFYNSDGDVAGRVDPGPLILTSLDADGGKLAVTAHSPRHPSELFILDGQRFVRWTDNNPWLSEVDFGKQRTVTYTARDGQEIEGILVEPVGGAKRGGSPTIFDVHGGPEAHESNGWVTNYSGPGQVAAGKGYAVFLPNYRGSTGYGVAFSKQHQNDYAGKEFNDLVDAIQPLAEMGVTDPERVGITGGSYGGYATGWAATALSEHFAAGVMFVGISNQTSKFGTTDIPNEMYLVHSRKWPWDDWQAMLEASPIFHVDKANTPLLIMHGEEDTRVSPTQSYELYRNIKVRKPDVPVRLVLYPGEGHGNNKAAARYDYNRRMMRWFDTYLTNTPRQGDMPDPRFDMPDGFAGSDDSEEE